MQWFRNTSYGRAGQQRNKELLRLVEGADKHQ